MPTHRLTVEPLEARDTPSAVTEAWPDDSFAQYQPLNNDTTYVVSGRVATLTDVDYYAFYAEAGTAVRAGVRAAVPTGNVHTEFDPTVGLFAPDGSLAAAADGGGVGSLGAARVTATANQSGIWRVAVSHHGDLAFDESVPPRPSWDPADPANTGPGQHTGGYVLGVYGAAKPRVAVVAPADTRVFYIDGNSPRMPDVTAELVGIAPAPGGPAATTWQTRVGYWAPDYVAIAGQRGPGRTLRSPAYDAHTVAGSTRFTPDFTVGGVPTLRGGRLWLSAQTQVGSLTLQATTPLAGPTRLQILGRNPDRAVVKAYLEALAVPDLWPGGTQYDYRVIMRKVMAQESWVTQFDPTGVPLWSFDGRRGVGLMQLTDPVPTPEQTWDWRRNLDAGVRLFAEKLEVAGDRLDALTVRIEAELPAGAVVAPITGDMIVEEALRAYNALDNGAGPKDEFRSIREPGGRLRLVPRPSGVLTNVWEHVPPAIRGILIGDPDYVNHVLGQEDF